MPEWKEWFIFEGEDEGGVFPTLRELCIINCPKLIGNLPSLFPSLSVIEIEDCPQLVASLPSPSALHELALTNCDKVALKELSPKLQSLGIGGCHVTLLEGGLPITLKTLQINGVLQLPESHYYPSIESLKVNKGLGSLWSLPLEFFPKLKSIEISNSDNLESLSASDKSLLDLTSLTKLNIWSCPNFVSFPRGGLCAPNLTQISISYCETLKSLVEGMHAFLPSPLYLELWYCPELESFPVGGLPSNLQILEIDSCDKLFLRHMEWGLQSLHSLREIKIWYDGREVGSFLEEASLPPSLIRLTISTHQPRFAGSWIWKLDSLPKIQHFFWKCLWQSIPIKELLASSGFMGDVICQLCNSERESIIHLLKDCPYVKAFWESSQAPNFVQNFFSLVLPSGLKINASNKYGMSFSYGIFSLPLLFGTFGPTGIRQSRVGRLWRFNPHYNRRWIKGFTRFIGQASSVEAELWALKDGLMLCVNLNLLAVEIEFDAVIMLGWVADGDNRSLHHASLIMDCKTFINQILQVRMKHCYHEANKCVDAIARMRANLNQDLLLFDSPFVDLSMILFYDIAGMYNERLRSLYVDSL